jgi:hypothetical protein
MEEPMDFPTIEQLERLIEEKKKRGAEYERFYTEQSIELHQKIIGEIYKRGARIIRQMCNETQWLIDLDFVSINRVCQPCIVDVNRVQFDLDERVKGYGFTCSNVETTEHSIHGGWRVSCLFERNDRNNHLPDDYRMKLQELGKQRGN